MRIGTELSSFTPADLYSSRVYVVIALVSGTVSDVSVTVGAAVDSVVGTVSGSSFLHPVKSVAVIDVISK